MSWIDKELCVAALTGAVTGVAVMIPLFMAPVIASGDPVRDDAGFPTSLAVLAVIGAVTYVFAYVLGPDRPY